MTLIEAQRMLSKQPLWDHQIDCVNRAKDLNGYALFMEMGVGKSRTAIAILLEKFKQHQSLLRTIIFCPPIVVHNWKDEWIKHSDVSPGKIVCLQGTGVERVKTFLKAAFDDTFSPTPRIFVTNYESLLITNLFVLFRKWSPEALVFDESHKCKSPESKRSKFADKLANPEGKGPYKYLLSGSPVLNSPMDLFMQFKILDGGTTFGDNFWSFRNRYFFDKNASWRGSNSRKYFPDWQILPTSLNEINRLLERSAMRVSKKDCLDLPPLIRETRRVEMGLAQKRAYKQLEKEYIAFINEETVSTTLAITKALRLMQIASGFVSLDGKGDEEDPIQYRFEENPKLDALHDILEELTPHSKVLIWATWKENYKQIGEVCEKLGVKYVQVHGGIKDKDKLENVRLFNTDDSVRVLIGHPGSGGIGINLVVAPYSIFYSRTFSLEHSLQAESRNHRAGSEIHEKITRIDLVSENTIDEQVVLRLLEKEEIGTKTLQSISKKLLAGNQIKL